jgi:hypothetical protein
MAGIQQAGDVNAALCSVAEQARKAWSRFANEVELERRMQEGPMQILGVAAAAGFVLGGGPWPVLRPFVKAMARTALSPANLLAIGAAVEAMRVASAGDDAPTQRGEDAPH